MPSCSKFEFDLGQGVADQLREAFDRLTIAPLNEEKIKELVGRKSGVYLLYRGPKDVVYVGKANGSLRDRLLNHSKKVRGRLYLDPDEMGFKGLYVDRTWRATGPEELLIDYFKNEEQAQWNTNGFGSKDPGKMRDGTQYKKNHYDVRFPIDKNLKLESIDAGEWNIDKLLKVTKNELPYLFRCGIPPKNLKGLTLKVGGNVTAGALLREIEKKIDGAVLTFYPNGATLYMKEKSN